MGSTTPWGRRRHGVDGADEAPEPGLCDIPDAEQEPALDLVRQDRGEAWWAATLAAPKSGL